MKRENLNCLDLLLFFKRWWIFILVFSLVGCSFSLIIKTKYKSNIIMTIESAGITNNINSKQGIADYSIITNKIAYIINEKNLSATVKNIDKKLNPSTVMKNVSVIEDLKTGTITVEYKSSNREELKPVLEAIITRTLTGMKSFTNTNVQLSNISNPIVVHSRCFYMTLAGIVSLVLSIGVALFFDIFRKEEKKFGGDR